MLDLTCLHHSLVVTGTCIMLACYACMLQESSCIGQDLVDNNINIIMYMHRQRFRQQ